MSDRSPPLFAALAPAVFVLLWSTGYIGSRMGAPYAEPLTFLLIRFSIVTVLMAGLALAFRAPWPNRRGALHAVIAGILIHGLYLGGVFWAIDGGMPAGVAALIVGLQPVLTAIAAGPLLGEQVGLRHWIGLGVGLVGLGLVLGPKLDITDSGISLATIGPAVFATAAITLGTIYQKRFATATSLLAGGVYQYLGAGVVVGLGALMVEDFEIVWSGEFVFAMAWLVLVLSIGGVTLLMMLIRAGAVSRVASLFYLVPALTALIAWLLFGETLTLVQLLGMAITGLAIALVARSGK
ncbi:DMT family transporter [Rhodobium gokarnense]|uniref:Drug/metabolite transporter (DMT)-like permease n=1 Tax=Rhodobium gokarnense TaxID=364296 RepID=A0ABT3HHJ8_9HYPH|nr:DMT family transporter [Rhodobium gokarnense]MCW2309863.1 drug/metabolite transporter (DMT)-like permease [Rhodobium gokarnense]